MAALIGGETKRRKGATNCRLCKQEQLADDR